MFSKTLAKTISLFVLAAQLVGMAPLALAEEVSVNSAYAATVKVISYNLNEKNWFEVYGTGSGTIIRGDGTILTNRHVVVDEEEEVLEGFEICLTKTVSEKPDCGYSATLIEVNESMDTALLRMEMPAGKNELPYLSYKGAPEPKIQENITLYGYPYSGGDTITVTQGHVSGFEEVAGVNYIKTDAYLSFGNSGGNAVNANGRFMGIPTYMFLDLGYFLDIREAETWINENIDKLVKVDETMKSRFKMHLKVLNRIEETGVYQQYTYPGFKWTLFKDSGWEFAYIQNNELLLMNEKEGIFLYYQAVLYPFEYNETYLQSMVDQIKEDEGQWADDYQEKSVSFKGNSGIHISYRQWEELENHIYLIPYGYGVLKIQYVFEDSARSKDKVEKVNELLAGFEFTQSASNDAKARQTFISKDPKFSVKRSGKWYFQEQPSMSGSFFGGSYWQEESNALTSLIRPDDTEVEFSIRTETIEYNDKNDTMNKKLQEKVKGMRYATVVTTNANLVMDGLKGFSFVYTFKEGKEEKKGLKVYVRYSQNQWIVFEYVDSEENYKNRLEEVKDVLMGFKHESRTFKSTGAFDLGTLKDIFTDMQFHRYQQEMMDMFNRKLVEGYGDGSFKPEREINRAEGLKIVLMAKMRTQYTDSQIEEELNKLMRSGYKTLDFKDTMYGWYTKYVRYAKHKGYVEGYKDTDYLRVFRPEQTVTLAETYSLLFRVFEIDYWKDSTGRMYVNWQKPLMNRARDMGLVPTDLDPDDTLTRAEFSAVVSWFLNNWEE